MFLSRACLYLAANNSFLLYHIPALGPKTPVSLVLTKNGPGYEQDPAHAGSCLIALLFDRNDLVFVLADSRFHHHRVPYLMAE